MSLMDFVEGGNYRSLPNYTDWRLPENRLKAFTNVYRLRIEQGELDHHHQGRVICDEMHLNDDQRAIYCLIFGQSYRNHVAMIVLQEFPDLLNTPAEKIQAWHDKNWGRLKYAKDTKWGLRKLPAFIESIKKQVGDTPPAEFYRAAASVGTTAENYYSLNGKLRELYGIGRMTAWLAQQTFFELFRFDINHWDMQLYDDTWSQFDSLCYLFNRMDLAYNKKKSKDDISLMEGNFNELMKFMNANLPFEADVYNVESCLCEYRKTAAPKKNPKEYTGWTSAELSHQYRELRDAWPEINWVPYMTGIMTMGEHVTKFWFSKQYFDVVYSHGLNFNCHLIDPNEPNAYEILDLPMTPHPESQFLIDDWSKVPNAVELQKRYHPSNYIYNKK